MRWLWFATALLTVSLLAACNEDGGTDAVRDTVVGFYQALNDDPPKAYTYLAQDCKDDISFGEFAGTLFYLERVFGESDVVVKDIDVTERDGDRMTARFHVVLVADDEDVPLFDEEDERDLTHFVKEDGRWRLADCEDFGGGADGDVEVVPATPEDDPRAEAVAAEADDDPSLPGEYVDLPGIYGGFYGNENGPNTAAHVRGPIDYSKQGLPPAGGPHWGSAACGNDPEAAPSFCGPVPWGIYRKPWHAESLVHNMEHAGIVIWYNTSDEEVIGDLEEFTEGQLEDGKMLVLTPYPDMEAETVAITVWSRRDKFPASEYSRERLLEFIDVLYCRFDPEEFCGRIISEPLGERFPLNDR